MGGCVGGVCVCVRVCVCAWLGVWVTPGRLRVEFAGGRRPSWPARTVGAAFEIVKDISYVYILSFTLKLNCVFQLTNFAFVSTFLTKNEYNNNM